jgi:hypothetical protein
VQSLQTKRGVKAVHVFDKQMLSLPLTMPVLGLTLVSVKLVWKHFCRYVFNRFSSAT